jgi:hypothetical protein
MMQATSDTRFAAYTSTFCSNPFAQPAIGRPTEVHAVSPSAGLSSKAWFSFLT